MSSHSGRKVKSLHQHALFRAHKTSKREFRRELEIAYDLYLQECAQKKEDSIDVDQRYVWSVLKSRRKKRVICRELKVNGDVYTDYNDICEAWAKHFESIFKTDRTLIHQDKEQYLKQQINMIRQASKRDDSTIPTITIDEVFYICKSLKNNKSTGLDNISYEHVKFGGKTLKTHLCSLFNLINSNCYIPICWKSSVIIPLFKAGNKVKNDPNAYRGISLTSCLSKIFEKVFITRLTSLQQNFPHVSQMAYQKSLCSTHVYFNVQKMIRHYTEQHSTMFVVLLDNTIKHTLQSYIEWTKVYVRFQFPQYISHKTTFVLSKY